MKKVYITYNQYTYWGIHDLMVELSLYLKNNEGYEVKSQTGGHLYIEEFDYHLPDCEIIAYDKNQDILKAISYSEYRTPILDIFKKRNNKKDIFILLHHRSWGIYNFDNPEFNFKIKPTTFYTFDPKTNYNYFYNQRQLLNTEFLIDRLFLRTSTGRGDEELLSKQDIINPLVPANLAYHDYLKLALTYKIGLAIPGAAELCHRDFEYMAVGIPMLRMEYVNIYDPPLISNYHYIAVDREGFPFDSNADRIGGKKYIEAYSKRFEEVKNNYEFLAFIAKNANDYYRKYCSPENRVNIILNKLEI